ncbi:hypothetical protein NHX12_027906 [Muraenolepis orangiensis]|uniref:Uncharacterized protein n=1 Tax=Muraenolepis orangiensis TaxID=630683 RepID=A0A9Q0IPP2_9TELE|nr:hypothetical protein NHX12_027906 [Muraenolepis orangiensis]
MLDEDEVDQWMTGADGMVKRGVRKECEGKREAIGGCERQGHGCRRSGACWQFVLSYPDLISAKNLTVEVEGGEEEVEGGEEEEVERGDKEVEGGEEEVEGGE